MAGSRLWKMLNRRAGPWIKRADQANRAQQWEAARHAYSVALLIKPDLREIWIQYGHVLGQLGEVRMAIRAYRRAVALQGDMFDAHFHLGRALLRQGEREAALLTFHTALGLDPEHVEILQHVDVLDRTVDVDRLEQVRLLVENGVDPAFLRFFDWEYYLFANRVVTASDVVSETAALRHFLATGVAALLPTHEHWGFDAEFYQRRYQIAASEPQALYRDWLGDGVAIGHSPNIRHAIETRLATEGVTNTLVKRILGDSASLSHSAPDAAIEAFLAALEATPPIYLRDPTVIDAGTVKFFSEHSDALYLKGDKDRAGALRKAILSRVPSHPPTRQHLADSYLEAGQIEQAEEIYRSLIKDGIESPWTYLNLARCRRESDDYAGELDVSEAAVRRFPGDRGFGRQLAAAQERNFTDVWTRATTPGEYSSIATAQDALVDACTRIAPAAAPRAIAPRPATGRRAVALIANEALEQCRLYRVEQKVEQLLAAGCEVVKFNADRELGDFLAAIDLFDVAIFYRVPAFPEMIRAIREANRAGLATVYEIDDLIFDAASYPPPMSEYGGLVTQAEHNELAMGVPLFAHAMQMCDYALTSTPALADAMAPLVRSRRCFVHRNAIGARHRRAIASPGPARADGMITILYGSGTKAHKEDFTEFLEPALIKVARRHPNVRIALVGYRSVGPELAQLGDRLILIDPIAEVRTYWKVLADADINLAVLKPSRVADCKSEIKWLEAAMLGIPSVVSATRTYEEIIDQGETGFLCRTAADWDESLERLVTDEALRRTVGNAARTVALRDYGEAAMATNIAAILADIMPRPRTARKRIAVVNVFYPPQAIGGATRVVHDNVCSLVAEHGDQFEIEVFTSIEGEPEGYKVVRQIVDGVRVTGVTTPNDPLIEQHTHDRRMGEVFDEFLTVAQVDLVHFHCIQRLTAELLEVTERRAIPYIITAHDGWWISNDQFLVDRRDQITLYDYALPAIERAQQFNAKAFRRMSVLEEPLRQARLVLPVSEPFAALYRMAGVENIRTIANGVSRLPERDRIAALDGRIRLAHIGGASRHKGYHLVRQALWCGDYRNLSLTVIDHAMPAGTSRDELWGTTPVRLLPRVEQKDVPALYHAIDVLLAPSIWPESHGLVTREALASGCWVIASDRGAIGSDVVEDVNGHVIDVGDAAALTSVLHRIDSDPDRYRAMPAAGRGFRSASEQADDLASLYLELLGDTGNAAAATTIESPVGPGLSVVVPVHPTSTGIPITV